MRFAYGQTVPWVSQFEGAVDPVTEQVGGAEMIALAGPDAMVLRGEPMPALVYDENGPRHVGRFTVAAGQTRDFVLTHFASHRTPPVANDVGEQLRETKELWREWDAQWTVESSTVQSVPDGRVPERASSGGPEAMPAASAESPRSQSWGAGSHPADGHGFHPSSDVAGSTAGEPRGSDSHEAEIRRSLLVIRALMHQRTGGLVGSSAASLPERIGGDRNWDSRYSWIRDASFALEIMLDHGHDREALQLRNWLLRAVAGDTDDIQNVYALGGERDTPEHSLDLPGYERSRPVRVGNSASRVYQTDTVGHLMVAFEKLRRRGLEEDRLSWPLQKALLGHLLRHYEDADQGLWEMRGERQFYTHSRVMLWAALQSGVDAVKTHGLDGDLQVWETHRDQLALEIWTSGYDPTVGTFVQHYGSTHVDASLLLLPTVGFVAWDDERMTRTVERITQELGDGNGLLRRYRNIHLPPGSDPADFESQIGQDGFAGEDAGHLSVTLWLAMHWARSGQVERAREVVRAVLQRGNDLGLLSAAYEGVPGEGGRMLGNIPQALPHLSLVQALDAIGQAEGRVHPTHVLDDPDDDPRPHGADTTHRSGEIPVPTFDDARREAGNAVMRDRGPQQ